MKKNYTAALKSILVFSIILLLIAFLLYTFLPKLALISLKKSYNFDQIPIMIEKYEINPDTAIKIVNSIKQEQLKKALVEIKSDSMLSNEEQLDILYSQLQLTVRERNLIIEKIPVRKQMELLKKVKEHPEVTINMLPSIKKAIVKTIEESKNNQ